MLQLLVALISSLHVHAQSSKPLQTGQQVTITYGSAEWNTDSKGIDSAFIVVKDKNTQKLVMIQLEETEPDSSNFKGKFSVAFKEASGVAPEVYVPPAELRKEKDFKKLYQTILAGQLPRKPVILRKTDKGPVLDVYDTRSQAERALKAYQDEMALQKQRLTKPLPSEQSLDAAKLALMQKLASEAAKRESERLRIEQIERQRLEEKSRLDQKASEAERARNRARAKELANQAMIAYQAADFKKAEGMFKEASDLDPENQEYLYKYAVSLYRIDKFDHALVTFKMTKETPANALERQYYIALIHLRLKEYKPSLDTLEKIIASNDPTLTPSALFYKGVVLFEMEQFEESKKPFETVIDTSTDPQLDQAAEDYLDRIAGAIAMKTMREKKFSVSGAFGALYDSNVTLSRSTDALNSIATDDSDFKLMGSGELEYRALFTDTHELSATTSGSFTQASKTKLQYTDPWLFNLALPYNYKGVAFKKGYKLTVKPGYEVLNMGQSPNDTSKKSILDSFFVSFDNTFVERKDYFATYGYEIRKDTSQLSSSIGPQQVDATKHTLRTSHMFLLDSAKKEAFVGSAGYTWNAAKGDEKKYKRLELGAQYVRPIWEDASLNVGLGWYKMSYPNSSNDRLDQNMTLTSGVSRAWNDWCTLNLNGSYSVNNSNVSTSEYSKLTIMSFATFKTNF